MPDLIRKRFGYGQLWSLRPACSQNRPGPHMPDPASRIRFSSVFLKKASIILCSTGLDLKWMAWSGFGQTHLVQKQAGLQESSTGPVSGKTQPSLCQFLTFTQTPLRSSTGGPDVIVQNQLGSDLVLAECVRFWPSGSGPGKKLKQPVCKNHSARF